MADVGERGLHFARQRRLAGAADAVEHQHVVAGRFEVVGVEGAVGGVRRVRA
ncbi:hypothetical protein ACGFWI_38415 [Streptomyces sp. NPDC048434]|uniref:hypothetical protein n=1 Tax=Streptomyces sp. NPDC048434 TaxID=3365549 RepID=UPI003711F4E7